MQQMWLGIKFFVGSQVPSAKKLDEKKKKFDELFTEEIQEIKQKSHKVRNETVQQYVPVKIPLKAVKFQTRTLRFYASMKIIKAYVTTTIFTLMLLNGLLVLVAPNFRNR